MMRFDLNLRAAVVLALVVSGCAHQAHKRSYEPPAKAELIEALQAHQKAVQSLNLKTRTTSWLGGDRVAATVLMLVERSGRLRFEAEVSLKGTVAALATDGNGFQLLDLERHEFHEGPACPQNVARLVRIPLRPQEIAAILLGDAPVFPGSRLLSHDWDADLGAERLEWETSGHNTSSQRVRVLLQKRYAQWVIVGVEGLDANGAWWRVRYDDFSQDGGVLMPGRIRFAEPGASFDDGVEIKIRDRRMNPEIPLSDFRLTAPPDMFVEPLGCEDVPSPRVPSP